MGFLKDKPKALHAFRVVTKGHIYLLAAKSAALKKDWMKVRCVVFWGFFALRRFFGKVVRFCFLLVIVVKTGLIVRVVFCAVFAIYAINSVA